VIAIAVAAPASDVAFAVAPSNLIYVATTSMCISSDAKFAVATPSEAVPLLSPSPYDCTSTVD